MIDPGEHAGAGRSARSRAQALPRALLIGILASRNRPALAVDHASAILKIAALAEAIARGLAAHTVDAVVRFAVAGTGAGHARGAVLSTGSILAEASRRA